MNLFGTITKWGEDDYSIEYIDAPDEIQNAVMTILSEYCTCSVRGSLDSLIEEVKMTTLNYMPHEEFYSLYSKYRYVFDGNVYSVDDFIKLIKSDKEVSRRFFDDLPEAPAHGNYYFVVKDDIVEIIDADVFMDQNVEGVKKAIETLVVASKI